MTVRQARHDNFRSGSAGYSRSQWRRHAVAVESSGGRIKRHALVRHASLAQRRARAAGPHGARAALVHCRRPHLRGAQHPDTRPGASARSLPDPVPALCIRPAGDDPAGHAQRPRVLPAAQHRRAVPARRCAHLWLVPVVPGHPAHHARRHHRDRLHGAYLHHAGRGLDVRRAHALGALAGGPHRICRRIDRRGAQAERLRRGLHLVDARIVAGLRSLLSHHQGPHTL